ncbi:MAG: helix-turn-helix domain-containing protein [Candidatus Eisenbacteria bacterium]|uniref:Helix-turn-helix domain-containing protein n=1 Tax=Eiseniibacteriota bacterium TaxID=2212470 RepID=A0A956NIB5_UNCEI|nr:helix-turn-helix domain-containing protein [Candidatus Eisenbacteria bacterium]
MQVGCRALLCGPGPEAGSQRCDLRNVALRTDAGLTQAELAKLVGTSRSVISRLEDDDYDGHSLALLRRVAAAVNKRVEIRFVPADRKAKSA